MMVKRKYGVKNSLIFESTEENDGAVTFSAIEPMGTELARVATVHAWPLEKRGNDANPR
jgi:hypothetical protein